MSGASPTVSVVMPVYNTARYLTEAIESVLGQTFTDLELLAIDDGSTDTSSAILRDFARRDPRVRVTVRENRGVVRTRNELLERCRGRYVAVQDSDDVSLPHRLATQVAYMDAHTDCVLLGSRVTLTDPYGSPFATSAQKLAHAEIDAELLTSGGGWAVVQPSAVMRTDAVRAAGGYRGTVNVGEDHDLFLRLAERGRVANLPEPLVRYRKHYESVTHTQYADRAKVKEQVLRDAYARRGVPMPVGWRFDAWAPTPIGEQSRRWGWAAIKAGNPSVARRHALTTLRHRPWAVESWRLALCALRGR